MAFNMQGIISLLLVLNCLALQCGSYRGTATESTTHIVSYIHQRRAQNQQHQNGINHNEFEEFDFENFRSNLVSNKSYPKMRDALQQVFGRYVENLDTNLEQLETGASKPTFSKNKQESEIIPNQVRDNFMDGQMNILENGFGQNEQHESKKNDTMWHRSKQSIPVLESVRHLVNSVRDGYLNNTEHVQHHRTLLSEMQSMTEKNTSTAIETEEEREMINESTDLQFLEVLGSIGSKLWGFLSNIRQIFAASAGSASGALSASSSSNSS